MPQKGTRRKHVPQRTCVGCRAVLPKRNLVRVVRGSQGVHVDLTGKASGRGAYLHDQRICWERALKGALAHALRAEMTEEDRERLLAYYQTLPDEDA